MIKKYLLLIALFFTNSLVFAHNADYEFYYGNGPILIKNGKELKNAWAGGLNAAQISKMHLDNDTIEDLVIFDRSNSKITTFLAILDSGQYMYKFAPEYEVFFPKMQNWMLLVDYNCDGKKDIFTNTTFGIKVYKNISALGLINFQESNPLLKASFFNNSLMSNIFMSQIDMPAIVDIDDDGDIDIMVNDFVSGHTMSLFRNQSMELFGHCDSLKYEFYTGCWGKFEQHDLCSGNILLNKTCQGSGGVVDGRVQHTGSTSLILDLDNDGRKDIILGHVDCGTVTALYNLSTNLVGRIGPITSNYPSTKPVNMPYFVATYHEDVTFDGKKDLIFSSNSTFNSGNANDWSKSLWLYTKNNDFTLNFVKKDFLQDQMLDFGEAANPAFVDIDADGDQDMVVGYKGKKLFGYFYSKLHLYRNIGTIDSAAFQLADTNYLNFAALQYTSLKPGFTDVDGNGSIDFYYQYTDGDSTFVNFIPNQANYGSALFLNPTNSIQIPVPKQDSIRLKSGDFVNIIDVNNDNKKDILVGKTNGRIIAYKNIGNNINRSYQLLNSYFGGIKPVYERSNISFVPFQAERDAPLEFAIIDNTGKIKIYDDFLTDINTLLPPDSLFIYHAMLNQYVSTNFGTLNSITSVDLNNDGLDELVVGSNTGGLYFVQNRKPIPLISLGLSSNDELKSKLEIYPNPASEEVWINSEKDSEICVISMEGKIVINKMILNANQKIKIDVSSLANGMYIIKSISNQKPSFYKIVITP